jgi:hypothetical protein
VEDAFPINTEIPTAITIVLIAIILAVYASVLKKNGWIGKTSNKTGINEKLFQIQLETKTQKQPFLKNESKVLAPKQEIQEPKILKTSLRDEEKKNNSTHRNDYKRPEESQKERPGKCNYNLGYLWTLPKDKTIPDECYCCSKLIECYKERKD